MGISATLDCENFETEELTHPKYKNRITLNNIDPRDIESLIEQLDVGTVIDYCGEERIRDYLGITDTD